MVLPAEDSTWSATRLARVSSASPAAADTSTPASVLVYSHRPEVRDAVRTAVGRRPAADVGPLTWIECTTGDDVVAAVDRGGIDLCILDGEAQPLGGGRPPPPPRARKGPRPAR